MLSDNDLVSLLLKYRTMEVVEKVAPEDVTRIITITTSSSNWKVRRNAVEVLGTIAQYFRSKNLYADKWNVLQASGNILENVLSIAKNDVNESVQRAAAWALSQINQWPEIFNRKVLDSKEVGEQVEINSSLPYLAPEEEVHYAERQGSLELAARFMPHLDGRGIELRWDTRDLYLGVLYRVLEDPETPDRKCIQYIYLWSKQNWPISQFFTGYFWPILTLVVLFERAHVEAFLPFVGLGTALIFYGIAKTLYPKRLRCFKNDSWYSLAGALLIGSLAWQYPYAPYVSVVAAIIIFVAVRFVLGPPPEHYMDYGPVYVYLRNNGGSGWRIDSVVYDNFHYETAEAREGELAGHLRNDTLYIRTDNMWHSFQLDRPHSSLKDSALFFSATLAAWAGVYVLAALFLLGFVPLQSVVHATITGIIAPIALIFLNSVATTPISPKTQTLPRESDKWILTHYKLVHLWNMIDEKADLVIRKKLQDPFRSRRDKGYWRTFRDPTATELAYEAIKKVSLLKTSCNQNNRRITE